ncbi:dihydrofolate reductase [bacterium]|nr:dihydrofolate reductase [bacterium]
MHHNRKLILYIASSLDGLIAAPGDNLDFLQRVQIEREDYGYADFVASVDTVLMGRRTYDSVTRQVDFPHADKTAYIWTRTHSPSLGQTQFYTGDLSDLIRELKNQTGKNLFCDGGAELAQALLQRDLLDEIILSVVPVFLGAGVRLFREGLPERAFQLLSAGSFASGMVQLHFERNRTQF